MSACSVARLTAPPPRSLSEFRRFARATRALPGDTLAGGRWVGVPLPNGAGAGSHPDLAVEQAELFELVDHELRALRGRLLLRSQDELRTRRHLVGVGDSRELFDLARERLLVETLHVAPRALLDGSVDEDLHEGAVLLDQLARLAARRLVRRDRGHENCRAVARQPRGHPADPLDVRVAIGLREAKAFREMRAHDVAVEILDESARVLEPAAHDPGDGRFACP